MAENTTFDEAKYNKLIAVIEELEDGLVHHATQSDTVPLDTDFQVQPDGQGWQAATNLVSKGKGFGGSVDQQNESLRQGLVKFRNALVAARGIFKDTDDLATYDIGRFVAEYPDFNTGGLGGGGGYGGGGNPFGGDNTPPETEEQPKK
ncbi:hypothetical protein Q5530_36870 [Saccharothrix sp. BKS2]|uniref:hypothetical protein n=1 Tax=Saccharothrix sp. BKS2 TaxID=3064400 RepID=UPI0039EA7CCB